jgi:hypothetical protein
VIGDPGAHVLGCWPQPDTPPAGAFSGGLPRHIEDAPEISLRSEPFYQTASPCLAPDSSRSGAGVRKKVLVARRHAQEKAPPLSGGAVRQSTHTADADCSVAETFDNQDRHLGKPPLAVPS